MKIKVDSIKLIPFLYCIFYTLTRQCLGVEFGLYPFYAFLGLMGLYMLLYFLNYKNQVQKINKNGFYAGYITYLFFIIMVFFIAEKSYSYALYEYVFYLLMFFSVCYIFTLTDYITILYFYEIVGVVLSIEAVWEFVTGIMPYRDSTEAQEIRRACGLLGTPLTLGTVLACIALMAFFMIKHKKTIIHYIVFILCISGLFVTQSRGPLVAFFCSLIVLMCFQSYQRYGNFFSSSIKKLLLVFLILGISYIIIVNLNGKVPFVTMIYSRLKTILEWGGEDYSNVLRKQRWEYGIQIFKDNWLIGYGVSSTGTHSLTGINVESGIIKKLVETGLVGFLIYYLTFGLGIIKSVKRCILNCSEFYPVALSVIIAILIENMVLQTIESVSVFLLFIINFAYLFIQGNKANLNTPK